jgi:hypothetical protein
MCIDSICLRDIITCKMDITRQRFRMIDIMHMYPFFKKKMVVTGNCYLWWHISAPHLSDNYVDLSDNNVDLSDNYVDLSNLFVDLSLIYLFKNSS